MDVENPKIWLDLTNPPHVNFFRPLIPGRALILTTRRYANLSKIVEEYKLPFKTYGGHYGRFLPAKVMGFASRSLSMAIRLPRFDLAMSHGSPSTVHIARLRRRPSVWFYDMDIPTLAARTSLPRLTHVVTPDCIPIDTLVKIGARKRSIVQYPGFKEEVYLADYRPDDSFLSRIPFREYVVLRGEAYLAEETGATGSQLLPNILTLLAKEGINVLFFPRYEEEREIISKFKNISIAPSGIDPLDACWFSRGVITGSTTFAREGAMLGVPAASFFPKGALFAVDKIMRSRGWISFSRDPKELLAHIVQTKRRTVDIAAFQKTKEKVIDILDGICESI
jgi:predicted glycosyltransferase